MTSRNKIRSVVGRNRVKDLSAIHKVTFPHNGCYSRTE